MYKISKIFEEIEFNEVREKKGTQGARKHKSGELAGQVKIKKAEYGFKPGNEGSNIPDYWILNPSQKEGGEILVVPLGCDEYETFINENRTWLESLNVLHNLTPQVVACKRTSDRPRSKKFGTSYTGPQAPQALKTKIKVGFNAILYEEFDDEKPKGAEFQKILNERSLPALFISPMDEDNKYYKDRHLPEYTNDLIHFRTHSTNSYESAEEFLNSVIDRLEGVENQNMKTYALGYQFNKKYRNWDPFKKSEQQYKDLTPKYKKERQGYSEPNLDVSVRSVFEVQGERIENSFLWTVSMSTKFGRKAPDEYQIVRKIDLIPQIVRIENDGVFDNREISASKTAQLSLEEIKKLNDNPEFPIINISTVSEQLRHAIYDFKERVKSIEPSDMIEVASYSAVDVGKGNISLNESEINLLAKKIAKKLK